MMSPLLQMTNPLLLLRCCFRDQQPLHRAEEIQSAAQSADELESGLWQTMERMTAVANRFQTGRQKLQASLVLSCREELYRYLQYTYCGQQLFRGKLLTLVVLGKVGLGRRLHLLAGTYAKPLPVPR